MAANLLAHAPDLFACGIARSGAYNRYVAGIAHSLNKLQHCAVPYPVETSAIKLALFDLALYVCVTT